VSGRSRWTWALALGSLAVIAVSFIAGSLVRSPWEQAADNARTRAVATVVVTEREFRPSAVEAVGTVSLGPVLGIPQTGTGDATDAVVTAAPAGPGAVVGTGDVVTEISGRPVILLSTPFRFYQDLAPGASGADVAALQEALAGLGLHTGAVDGIYGAATSAAVEALYRHTGYSAPRAGAELVAASVAAGDTFAAATRVAEAADAERGRARAAYDAARRDGAEASDVASLEAAAQAAEEASEHARADVEVARRTSEAAAVLAGTPLPRREVARLPGVEAEVVAVAGVDATVSPETPAVRLRVGAPSVTVRVPVSALDTVVPGAVMDVHPVAGGAPIAGQVTDVAPFSVGTDVGAAPGHDVTIALPEGVADLRDASEVIATPRDRPAPVTSPAVPVVAVRQDSGGQTYVLVPDDDDRPERVDVDLGPTADGFVAVGEELSPGDRVLIGSGP
jgi:peptidoglycan hydrolase-like protein with peptidoglycan-binding domain